MCHILEDWAAYPELSSADFVPDNLSKDTVEILTIIPQKSLMVPLRAEKKF